MSARTFLDELVARLQLAQGGPALLLLVFPPHTDLITQEVSLAGLLSARGLVPRFLRDPMDPAEEGPARWARLTAEERGASVYLRVFNPPAQLALRAAMRTFNAQREDLRGLAGPLLLLVTERTEKELRQHAPDFFSWTAERYAAPEDLEQLWRATVATTDVAQPAPSGPSVPPIRFLHLSDLHLRPDRRHDQDRVLRGLHGMLGGLEERIDLIFVTGDLAHAGKPHEYVQVVGFLRDLLSTTQVDPRHLFVVPGNHDVDRDIGRWLLRTLGSDDDSVAFFTREESRRRHLEKFSAYQKVQEVLGEGRPIGLQVGEKAVEEIDVRGTHIAVASFNSAWFAQGDDDPEKLWLGEANVDGVGRAIGQINPALAIALMHHPIEWLAESERAAIENYLDRSFDIVLRGHLHKDRVRAELSGRGGFLNMAAAAAYQGSKWPNGCFVGEIDLRGRGVRVTPYAFGSGADPWTVDSKVFPSDKDHRHTFRLPPKEAREPSLIDNLAPVLAIVLLRMDEQRREQILRDLDVTPSKGDPDHRMREAVDTLRRQGRLAELWDAAMTTPDALSYVSTIAPALAGLLPEEGRHSHAADARELLDGFGEFWRSHGQKYQALLRRVWIAPELLFLAYVRRRRTIVSWSMGISSPAGAMTSLSITNASSGEDLHIFLVREDRLPAPTKTADMARVFLSGSPGAALVSFSDSPVPRRAVLSEDTAPSGAKFWSLRVQI